MPDGLRLLVAFVIALAATWALTPLALRLAIRTSFLDHPVDYKQHGRATPTLGGLAVIAGFLLAVLALAPGAAGLPILIGGMLVLAAIGIVDDRVQLGVRSRLTVQLVVALAVVLSGHGWELFGSGWADGLVTVAWLIGVVNAFNLLDNIDGALGTVGAASALGIGVLATAHGEPLLGVVCFALAGACAGFLPHNLARPSRIFLGDGGSGPIGFVLAFAVANLPYAGGAEALFALTPLVGLAILDTALTFGLRARRGAPLLEGGCDHLTHRLFARVGSQRRVAACLFAVQISLGGLAALMYGLDPAVIATIWTLFVVAGLGALSWIITRRNLALSRDADGQVGIATDRQVA